MEELQPNFLQTENEKHPCRNCLEISDDSYNSYIVFNAYGGTPKNPELSRVMSSVKVVFRPI